MGGDLPVDGGWLLGALDESSDLVIVMAADTTIKWVSAAVRRLGGYEPAELLGRSMVEFLHPEDLERAAEVLDLANDDAFDYDTPMTPALYRLRTVDGSWMQMEVNATRTSTGETDLLLVIRRAGDLVLTDHLLEVVTADEPVESQLDAVLELGRWRYPADGYVVMCSRDAGERLVHSVGVLDPKLSSLAPVDEPTPWGVAMARDEPVSLEGLDDTSLVSPELAAAAREEGFDSVFAVPVADPGHAEDACIVVWSTPDGPSVAGQRYPMANMKRALALSLQWQEHRRELDRAANVDGLTGVASRQRFFAAAPGWLDQGARAVLYVDLDHFKAVNDGYGHSAGDYVLATTAARLVEALGPDVLLGRLGGDEFAVLCTPGTTAAAAEQVAASIVDAVCVPIELNAGTVTVGASVGVAMRGEGESLDAVLERADQGLLATKAAGRGGWKVEA
jgi:diguanylate cyclase (GGDEF)-like protein/PAS domain S-box-containing protein